MRSTVQIKVKICGITTPEAAISCLEAGADMIGLVYYPPSPRHVNVDQIEKILDAVEPFRQEGRQTVLVGVDQLPEILDSRFDFLQSYGTQCRDVPVKQIRVIKDYETFNHYLELPAVDVKDESLFALEMSKGFLPGGNGAVWDWSIAEPFCRRYRTLIAGGVSPENVADVIHFAMPYGIDVSSGVESAPGIKDISKVKRLIENVCRVKYRNF